MDVLGAGTVGDHGQERTSTVKRQHLPIPGGSVSPQRDFMKTKTTSNESSDIKAEDWYVSYLWLTGAKPSIYIRGLQHCGREFLFHPVQ